MWPRKKDPTPEFTIGCTSFARLVQHFQSNDWAFESDEQQRVVHTTLTGDSGQIRIVAAISEDDDLLEVLTILPVNAPPNKRYEAAEFCNRASFGMKIGRFELDFDDGTVRFHASAPFDDGDLPESVIHRCVGTALVLADHYFPHLMSVLYGGMTSAHAVQTAEAQLQQKS